MITDQALRDMFKPELRAGERLLWAGKPASFPLNPGAVFLAGFLTLWTAMAVFMSGMFMSQQGDIPLPFSAVPFVFVCIGSLALLFSFKGLIAPSRQIYAITDQRGIIISPFLGRSIASLNADILLNSVRKGSGDKGTLFFGPQISMFNNQSFDALKVQLNAFHNIKNAAEIESLIHKTFSPKT